ncbi:hypothetical protein CXZ10_09865 [Pleomorphomonas diazotrophica]|uniref:Acyltransferase 3 domain-containing protein n=1 Tax=Pleomorphomonas diazotrophica TaxID=1166257 RepID=A0A1I4VK24_9HYPH|nr:acyltransferase family protein [Pleomorphomonas diazotrophica]PKR89657.1 hypothetical protein CXZ10_09865 [Pleomorphomonas diazotrophica]SFN01614.1 Acyltransferase family protein [Pleomorphomonas diazotrophica]
MFTSLQAGRALVATAVLFSHMTVLMAVEKYGGLDFFDGWLKAGAFGLDYFFVLSGFIIYAAQGKHLGRLSALKPYLLKRFSRVFPIYWVYTAGFTSFVL